MVSFQGSISNYGLARKLVIWVFVLLLPFAAVAASIGLFLTVSWWGLILIFDLMVMVVAISLSGLVFRGHRIDINDGEITFTKGWSGGRIPFRNLIKVYRVSAGSRDTILLVYNEPSTKNNPNRCLTIEHMFSKKDRDLIFDKLYSDHDDFSFPVVDMASVNQIKRDKVSIGWVPV
jgi:hypothetical protein